MRTPWWRFAMRRIPTARVAPARLRSWPRLALFGVTLAALLWAALVVYLRTDPPLQVNMPSPVSIQAPRTLIYTSELLTEEARARAANREENLVYQADLAVLATRRSELDALLTTISQIRSDPSRTPAQRIEALAALPSASLDISETLASDIARLSDSEWEAVQESALNLYDRALVQYNYELHEADLVELRDRTLWYWTPTRFSQTQASLTRLFTSAFLRVNMTLDEAATAQRKQEAHDSVGPQAVQVLQGESIVREGDLVTPLVLEKLRALEVVRPRFSLTDLAGRVLLVIGPCLLLTLYLGMFEPALVRRDRALLALGLLIMLVATAAKLSQPLWQLAPYAFPLAGVALVVTALFGGRLALVLCTVLSLFLGALSDGQLAVTAVLLVSAGLVTFVIGRAERSISFLVGGLVASGATAMTQLAFYLSDFGMPTLERIGPILLYSSVSGALSAAIAFPLTIVLGRIAAIVTPFQLMELAHPAQPLLRRLIREAPGTYYHSVAVGNLAESAAETVGADALLLRVAAYYHDIGKMVRPYFFTDNQMDRANVHNDLDPQVSAEIIVDHVRSGIAMARQAGLPQQIIDFIATHHGTSLIKHFYQLALQRYDTVDIEDYRYPGPLPKTKEQAILMLADSVEATVRAKAQSGKVRASRLDDTQLSVASGSQTVEELVESIVEERIRSNQLDAAPLTLSEIARLKASFTATLQGIYHPRVDYAPPVVNM